MSTFIFVLVTVFLRIMPLCLLSVLVFAQGGPSGTDGDPDQIPVDGGIGLLVAAGVAYGVKKYRDRVHPHDTEH